jgi:hemin uptake protein HemP
MHKAMWHSGRLKHRLKDMATDRDEHPSEQHTACTSRSVRNVVVNGNRIDSRALFVATREVLIGHGEETYRLRLTGQNKLILTK